MANLLPGQFFDHSRYAYRIDLFLDKIRKQSPFTLNVGNKKVIIGADLNALAKAFRLRDKNTLKTFPFIDTKTDEEIVGIGKFKKTDEFGRTGAADVTETTESAQCVYNVALMESSSGNDYKFGIDSLEKAFKSKSSVVSEKKFSRIKQMPERWIISSESGAKFLKKKFPKYFGFGYQHHRGSKVLVEKIETQFKKINRIDKHFGEVNKWSPADIWMVNGTMISDIVKELENTTNFLELNQLLEEMIANQILLGVSLKQMNDTPTMMWKNYKQGGFTPPSYKFEKFLLAKVGFLNSKQTHIFYDGGEIVFKCFSGAGSYSGEILGKRARMGKVSGQWGPKSTIGISAKQHLGRATTGGADILRTFQSGNHIDKSILYNTFWENYQLTGDQEYQTKKAFAAALSTKKDDEWFVSKYMGTEIMSLVHQATPENRNRFLTALLSYASSESENSAPFVIIK
jgi:hypothetical protein